MKTNFQCKLKKESTSDSGYCRLKLQLASYNCTIALSHNNFALTRRSARFD